MMRVALIGLGEVGRVLAEDLPLRGGAGLACFDIAFRNPASKASRNAAELCVVPAAGALDAVRDCDVVISAVTAANDVEAARSVVAGLRRGAWFLDLNSASPDQKRASADAIDAAGGRYVEAAVMAPIEPRRLAAPMLLGGPHAEAFAPLGLSLGFSSMEVFAETVGPASATKLCRSVIIKGVEALLTESMLAAHAWGVESHVLDSLSNLLPSDDWEALAAYMISRSIEHGERRAEEMIEAAGMVSATGVLPLMSQATAQRQRRAAQWPRPGRDDTLSVMLESLHANTPAAAVATAGEVRR